MFRSHLIGATVAALLVAPCARAEPFDDFVNFCLRANADPDAVADAVKSAGWFQMPAEMLGDDSGLQDSALYISEDPALISSKGPSEDMRMLMTGWGAGEEIFKVSGVKLDMCMVLPVNGETQGFEERLQALFAFEPIALEDQITWVFSRRGQSFQSEHELMDEADKAEEIPLPRIARTRKIYFASIAEGEDGMGGLALAAVRPSE